jgi:hypothetical protein
MKILKHFLIISFIAAVMTSCAPINLSKLGTYYAPIPESSKKLDIPKYGNEHQFKGYPYTYWNFCKQKQKQLGLESPETSIDSLIFRMWITNPIGKKAQPHGLVEIKYDSTGWNGKLVLMHVDFKLGNLSETITDSKVIDLKPMKTDWTKVVDSLNKLKISELPTDDLIPEYYSKNSGYGGNSPTFSFEYSTKDLYRFYQYNDIYRVADKFWQPKNIIDILELLEDEFQWDTQARKYF